VLLFTFNDFQIVTLVYGLVSLQSRDRVNVTICMQAE